MPDTVTTESTTTTAQSSPAGVPAGSVRSYIVLGLVFTVCYLGIRQTGIPGELADLTLLALGYYFGSRTTASG